MKAIITNYITCTRTEYSIIDKKIEWDNPTKSSLFTLDRGLTQNLSQPLEILVYLKTNDDIPIWGDLATQENYKEVVNNKISVNYE